ncbi:kinase [Sphingobium rhizovicinum]|uniref:Kinase n=1 Tax=Sphingobium rhizovicinum TaxID=432308 RepID=A0ABV7NKB6_9SPHN
MTQSLDYIAGAARKWLSLTDKPLILGLCGAQGSGKSTLAAGLQRRMQAEGRMTAVLSLDDLYLDGAERERLARDVHPLLRTRGVPGTHDVARGIAILDTVKAGQPVALPRFDKGKDEPADEELLLPGRVELLIFEGWCVGARPQPDQALANPVNALERDEDAAQLWRRHVNRQLSGPYADLFARIDRLVLLAAPDFSVVHAWRSQQEEALRAEQGDRASHAMDVVQIDRFIQHYERLTRHILDDMPGYADHSLFLDKDRGLRMAQ